MLNCIDSLDNLIELYENERCEADAEKENVGILSLKVLVSCEICFDTAKDLTPCYSSHEQQQRTKANSGLSSETLEQMDGFDTSLIFSRFQAMHRHSLLMTPISLISVPPKPLPIADSHARPHQPAPAPAPNLASSSPARPGPLPLCFQQPPRCSRSVALALPLRRALVAGQAVLDKEFMESRCGRRPVDSPPVLQPNPPPSSPLPLPPQAPPPPFRLHTHAFLPFLPTHATPTHSTPSTPGTPSTPDPPDFSSPREPIAPAHPEPPGRRGDGEGGGVVGSVWGGGSEVS